MFALFTRLPLRRCLHTTIPASESASRSKKVALAATVATATYMTWRLTRKENHITLDSEHYPANVSITKPQISSPPTTTSILQPPLQAPDSPPATDGGFLPDADQAISSVASVQPEADNNEEASTSSDGGATSGGAYNPQTGEINWDCPCLGGMAHGPCGPEFREAFSCFVFSEVEPKGMNCVEKFAAMQNCFRAHPELYADEILNDDDDNDDKEHANADTANLPDPEQNPDKMVASTLQPSRTEEPHLQKSLKDS